MEKIPDLYNKEGQVNDPEIAKSMAENEDLYHRENAQEIRERYSSKSDEEYKKMIDEEVEYTGEVKLALKNLPMLIEKIRSSLSPEELEMFRLAVNDHANHGINRYIEILRRIAE